MAETKRWHTQHTNILDRLEERTHRPDGEVGCWEWTGSRNQKGYGKLKIKSVTKLTHRLSYQEANDCVLPASVVVRHTCDNRVCWNPQHLISGTHADNAADRSSRNRSSIVGRPKGSNKTQLSKEDVLEIRALHAAGIQQTELAEQYGLYVNHIWKIINRRVWAGV